MRHERRRKYITAIAFFAAFFLLAFITKHCTAQPAKQYQLEKVCAKKCKNVRGTFAITDKEIYITTNGTRLALKIAKHFKLNGREYYHVQGITYKGMIIITPFGFFLELIIDKIIYRSVYLFKK